VKMENFIGTKSQRNFLEGLKRKVGIFIGTKNIINPDRYIYIPTVFIFKIRCFNKFYNFILYYCQKKNFLLYFKDRLDKYFIRIK